MSAAASLPGEPKEWEKLSDYRHARLCTEMFFGSRDPHTQTVPEYDATAGLVAVETTWTPAAFTAVREIFDNALDELVKHGQGDRLEIGVNPRTMEVTVTDNGRGVPINFDETEQNYAATVLLSNTKSGRNFGKHRGESRGMNGVGASIVNFCSAYFDLDIDRDRKHFEQRFHEADEHVADPPMIFPATGRKTGTTIRFKLSELVFPRMSLPANFLAARVYEIALCYPSLKVFYNGKRIVVKTVEAALFPERKPISFAINADGFDSRFWLSHDFMKDGAEYVYSLVNAIPVFEGGTHIDAFRRGFYSGMLTGLARESRRRKLAPNRGDMSDGLLIYNITQMTMATFGGQAKMRLINENVAKIIGREMDDPEFFRKVIRDNPEWISAIYRRCEDRTQKKDQADVAKINKAAKRKRVEGLEDACGNDRSKCICFLTEGLSAVSGIIEARNSEIHGALPLSGKPMNVRDVALREIVENEALMKVVNALGLSIGQRANRHTLRYGKVFLTMDADPDGLNITALMVNFFYTLWPELFDPEKPPFINVFETPLIIAVKGKQRKYWYADNYLDFDPDRFTGYDITRAKGLAALKRADWIWVLANPKVIPIVDDGKLADALKLLFDQGKGAADARKEWIGM